jgi:hypothetical protein
MMMMMMTMMMMTTTGTRLLLQLTSLSVGTLASLKARIVVGRASALAWMSHL